MKITSEFSSLQKDKWSSLLWNTSLWNTSHFGESQIEIETRRAIKMCKKRLKSSVTF